MGGFDGATVRVVVTEGPNVGEGKVVLEETASPDWDRDPYDLLLAASVDQVLGILPKIVYERLGIGDGYSVAVTGSRTSQGGDGSGLLIVVQLLQGVQDHAWQGLAGLLLQYIYDELKKPKD